MEFNTLEKLGLLAYPAWAGICIFAASAILARAWRRQQISLLILVLALIIKSVSYTILSLSITGIVSPNLIRDIRAISAISASMIYFYAVYIVIEWFANRFQYRVNPKYGTDYLIDRQRDLRQKLGG